MCKLVQGTCATKDIKNGLGSNVITFCLITALLHKPHNYIINVGVLCTCNLVNKSCDKIFKKGRTQNIVKTIGHFWIGKMFYFYQAMMDIL